MYTKDVLMSVWAALWNAAAIAWYRQKWCITDLKAIFQYAWMAASVLLVWMPVFQASALLSDEIDEAFQNGKGTKDTKDIKDVKDAKDAEDPKAPKGPQRHPKSTFSEPQGFPRACQGPPGSQK